MAEGKRYFWLKLKDDFFSSKRIKKLRKLAGGDTYLIIYLKMQLKALKTDGILQWTGLEDDFADELALDLDEEPDNVKVTLQFLLSCGLIESSDNVNFLLPYVAENTGSEGASAQRVREFRAKQALQCNTSETHMKQIANGEIEKEIDIEIEKEIEKKPKKFIPPTLEEVKAYVRERNSGVDPVKFWEYYEAGGWKDSKGNPVKNWKQKLLTWEKKDGAKEGRNAPVSADPNKWLKDSKFSSAISELMNG